MLQSFVLLQLLRDLSLRIATGAQQVFLGVVYRVLQERGPRLGYLQLLLDGMGVILAWIGRELGQPASLFLHLLKPAVEGADSRIQLAGLAVVNRGV